MPLEIKKVVKLSKIPLEVRKNHWVTRNQIETYVEVHIDQDDNEQDSLTIWLKTTYPELIDEDSFFIYMDC